MTSGTLLAVLDVGIGMAYLPGRRAPAAAQRFEIDVRGTLRARSWRRRPLVSPTKES